MSTLTIRHLNLAIPVATGRQIPESNALDCNELLQDALIQCVEISREIRREEYHKGWHDNEAKNNCEEGTAVPLQKSSCESKTSASIQNVGCADTQIHLARLFHVLLPSLDALL